ncbi:MAG: hypothetical protein V4510_00990 [bacterium]
MEVTIQLYGNSLRAPVSAKDVAAVATSQGNASSFADVRAFFNPCSYASATTGTDGTARLKLVDGQEFRVAMESPSFIGKRPTSAVHVAKAGLTLEAFWYDPAGARLGECGQPDDPAGLPDEQAFAVDLVPVNVRVRWETPTGGPVAKAEVAILDASAQAPFDATFDMDRFFTSCVLASAQAGADGVARLWLPAGAKVMVAVPPAFLQDHGGEVLADQVVSSGAVWTVPVLHDELNPTLTGTIMLPNDQVATHLRFNADDAVSAAYQSRLSYISFTTMSWTNSPTAWGDLWVGYKVAGGSLQTDEIFDSQEGPFDGGVTETMFPVPSKDLCPVRSGGLDFIVYSVPQQVVAPLGLAYKLDTRVDFRDNPLFTTHDFTGCDT